MSELVAPTPLVSVHLQTENQTSCYVLVALNYRSFAVMFIGFSILHKNVFQIGLRKIHADCIYKIQIAFLKLTKHKIDSMFF